jgi:hypothetical protein
MMQVNLLVRFTFVFRNASIKTFEIVANSTKIKVVYFQPYMETLCYTECFMFKLLCLCTIFMYLVITFVEICRNSAGCLNTRSLVKGIGKVVPLLN